MHAPHVLTTRAALPGDGLTRLERYAGVVRPRSNDKPTTAELADLAEGVDAILALGNDVIDERVLEAAGPNLRAVSLASMGYDKVAVAAAAKRGVVVTHTPGVLTETTADLALSLILMARRRLGAAVDSLRAGAWDLFRMEDYLGLDIHGATLGVVGFGQIGQALARRASGFGMRVLFSDDNVTDGDGLGERTDLDTLLATADIISLHVPLTKRTHGLIGTAELAAMKPNATIVNTSRGGVVDEKALLAALSDGTIHSAGLDVYETEPLGPDVDHLMAQQRLVALPHVGSATEATRAAMVDLAIDNIVATLTDQPVPNPVPGTATRPSASLADSLIGGAR